MKANTYEGMFLFDPSAATQWETVENEVGRIMKRAGAELIGIEKWDERRLTFEIKHRKRACYALTYFKAPCSSITGIERDAQLSEMIIRLLVVSSALGDDQLAEFRAKSAEQSTLLKSKPEPSTEAEEKPAPAETAPTETAPVETVPVETAVAEADETKPAEAGTETPEGSPEPAVVEESTEEKPGE
ncbi:MAG: 30S ribosomal protein S6 [Phycisphaerae bacterium]|nr:30S ribosomal protein S6 [Phycisphaerae bacterium]